MPYSFLKIIAKNKIFEKPLQCIEKMPKSVVMCGWYYWKCYGEAVMRSEYKQKMLSSFEKLSALGYDQVPTASVWAEPDNLEELTRFCAERINSEHWLGMMQTTWERIDKDWMHVHKKAIICANNVKPITLTADMIFKSNRVHETRNPLSVNPDKAKMINYSVKLVQILALSAIPSIIVMEVSGGFTWASLAQILVKILPMVSNSFLGYEYGWRNVTVDTVNYLNDQSDLMCEFLTKNENKITDG